MRTLIGIVTLVEPFTPLSVTWMVCALATLVSGMVTTFPLVMTVPPLLTPPLPIVPIPDVTAACGLPLTDTLARKVTTIV